MSRSVDEAVGDGGSPAPTATEDRLIGGVCGRIAAATGIPANLIRIAWVMLALILAVKAPAAFWIVVVPYLLAWFLSSRAPPAGSRPEPRHAASPAATAPAGSRPAPSEGAEGRQAAAQPAQAAPPAQQARPAQAAPPAQAASPAHAARPAQASPAGERPYLRELVRYLWGAETTPRPLYKMWAHGFVLSDFEIADDRTKLNYRFMLMPYGRIVVWPGWLVFMTESLNEPGTIPSGRKLGTVALDAYREYRRFLSIFRLLRTAHATLTKEQRDIFERALVNPNSIVLPLSQVRSFHQERWRLAPRIVIETRDGRELMFGPNGMFEIGFSFWRLTAGYFGPWHPKLQRFLEEGANTAKEE